MRNASLVTGDLMELTREKATGLIGKRIICQIKDYGIQYPMTLEATISEMSPTGMLAKVVILCPVVKVQESWMPPSHITLIEELK